MREKFQVFDVMDNFLCRQILDLARKIEDSRWIRRNELDPIRGLEGEKCQYDFCGHSQMPRNLVPFLKNIAPSYKDFFLNEIAINRYKIGDFIGKHRDRHLYRRNLVIALQEEGDGLMIEDNYFLEDKIGQGVLFEGIGPIHAVPPVKKERYSLIYLYE